MGVQYKIISKFYDLIDVIYFRKNGVNPRCEALNLISDRNQKILDICAGTCTNSIMIAKKRKQAKITAIDLSKEMLALADEKISRNKIDNLSTKVMDATNLEFIDKEFDTILISLVLHEIDENLRCKIFKEAKRVLKEDGKIIIVEWDTPKTFLKSVLFTIIKLIEPKGFKEFLSLDMKEYLQKFSLKVISEKKCDYSKVIEISKIV